jgi:NADPH-dependent glutamate synthase beta subunit-like oxidoreductase
MPHALTELRLAEVTRPDAEPVHKIRADVCVAGAGPAFPARPIRLRSNFEPGTSR